MTDFDKQLLAEFLSEYYAQFQQFLDFHDIEPAEAERIIDEIKFC